MDEPNNETNRLRFCRICGRALLNDSVFCSGCGTKIIIEDPEKHDITDTAAEVSLTGNDAVTVPEAAPGTPERSQISEPEHKMSVGVKPKRKILKIIIPILLAVILVCTAILIISKRDPAPIDTPDTAEIESDPVHTDIQDSDETESDPERIDIRDIDEIDGCPEFFDVRFGMTAEQASALVDIEHIAVTGYETSLGSEDSLICLEEGAEYELYGIPVDDVLCGFDVLELDTVLIIFSKEDASMSSIVDLYIKVYGEPTQSSSRYTIWSGKMTTIDIYDSQLVDADDNVIVVRYEMSPNRNYKALTFDGPEHDPCNFLETQVFTKGPEYYTDGMVLGEDYNIEKNEYFTKYTLYPMFEFMGIEEGMTAISFDVDASEIVIGVCSYLFLLEREDASDRFQYIKNVLEEAHGTYSSCVYTSMIYDELGMQELSYSELLSKIDHGTQGLYYIQWTNGASVITLNLEIDPNLTYYSGAVSASDRSDR